jgi:hypothetical protein
MPGQVGAGKGNPPQKRSLRDRLRNWRFYVPFLVVLALLVVSVHLVRATAGSGLVEVFLYLTAALLLGFLVLFALPLRTTVSPQVTFAYVFIFLTLGLIAAPALLSWQPDLRKKLANSPMGIVKGCKEASGQRAGLVPDEISCAQDAHQWLVNIGGAVELSLLPDLELAAQAMRCAGGAGVADASACPDPKAVNARVAARMAELETLRAAERLPDHGWRYRVAGGLVVPLYFVLVAVMGAAVGMMRRVPEYHRRVSDDDESLKRAKYARMTPLAARESIVFQIMQVVSAPLIGMVAYSFIDPSSLGGTVGLAFLSGFASERVLLMIRTGVELGRSKAESGRTDDGEETTAAEQPAGAEEAPEATAEQGEGGDRAANGVAPASAAARAQAEAERKRRAAQSGAGGNP